MGHAGREECPLNLATAEEVSKHCGESAGSTDVENRGGSVLPVQGAPREEIEPSAMDPWRQG